MHMRLFALLFGFALLAGSAATADEIRGKVKSLDADKGSITVTVGDADQTFQVQDDAKVVGLYGKKLKKATVQDVPSGLRGVKEGADVTLTTAKADDATVVSQVKVEDLQAKLKKKAKKKKVK
jgi:hypothetical protein